jgi:hypothetical protein
MLKRPKLYGNFYAKNGGEFEHIGATENHHGER